MKRIFVVKFSHDTDLEEYSRVITATFLLSGSIRVENKLVIIDNNRDVCICIDGAKMKRYGPDIHTSKGWLETVLGSKNPRYLGAEIAEPESCLNILCQNNSLVLITSSNNCKPLQDITLLLGREKYENIIILVDTVHVKVPGKKISVCIDNELDYWEKIVVLNIFLDNMLPSN